MRINAINRSQEIDISQIYFYYVNNKSIVVMLDRGLTPFDFDSYLTAKTIGDNMFQLWYKQLCIVPNSAGTSYRINRKNLEFEPTVAGAVITLTFPTLTQTITCVDATYGTYHKNLLVKNFNANAFLTNLSTFAGNILYVDPNYFEDITNKLYATISRALTNAVNGDLVFIKAGTYSEKVNLKQGVTVYAEPNVFLNDTGVTSSGFGDGVLRTNVHGTTCNVYGYINISTTSLACISVTGTGSDLFIEMDNMSCLASGMSVYSNECTLLLKGKFATHVSSSYTWYDFDFGDTGIIDFDFIAITGTQSMLFGTASGAFPSIFIIRNAYLESNTAVGNIDFSGQQISAKDELNLIDLGLLNRSRSGIANVYYGNSGIDFNTRCWNITLQATAILANSFLSTYTVVVSVYTNIYANCAKDANITINLNSLIINTGLIVPGR